MRSVLAFVLVFVGEAAAQSSPFAEPRQIRGSRIFPATAVAADVDLDGVKDLIVGNAFSLDTRNGPVSAVLLNADYKRRSGENLEPTGELGLVSHPAVAAGDMNGDQLPDVVTISDKGAISLYLHRGSTPNAAEQPRFRMATKFRYVPAMDRFGKDFPQFKTYRILVGDFTGDGHADLAYTGDVWLFFDVLATSGMAIMAGDGKGGFHGNIQVHSSRCIQLDSCDLNRDALPDLVGLTADNELITAIQYGAGKYRTRSYRLSTPVDANRMVLSDVNNDGWTDFVVSGGEEATSIAIYLADNRGIPGKLILPPIGFAVGTAIETLLAEDFDADGNEDLALVEIPKRGNIQVRYLRGNGKGEFASPIVIPIASSISQSEVPMFSSFAMAVDFDGDQNKEILISSVRDPKDEKLVQWIVPNRSVRRWGFRTMGEPTRGAEGIAPHITCAGGAPAIGNRSFAIALSHAPGQGARAALIMSQRLERRSHAGLTVHMFPFLSFGVRTKGAGTAGGYALVPLEIPNLPGLVGRRVYAQWIAIDPRAPNPLGLSATPALEIWLGPR